MATIQRDELASGGLRPDLQARRPRPVLWWSSAGFVLLVFQVFVLAKWALGSNFKPTDPGPDALPAWESVVFTALQIAVPVAAVVLLYLWVIRPWRRHGYLTTDAMIALAASTVFFWDMVMNYTSVTLFYNSHLINRGAWANGAWPTWTSPHANRLPEPLLIVPPAYTALVFSQVIAILWLLRKIKARWPGVGIVGIVVTIVVGLTLTDTLVEGLVLRTGVYAYPGGIRAITLFAGQTYQVPLSETVSRRFCPWRHSVSQLFPRRPRPDGCRAGNQHSYLGFQGQAGGQIFAIYGAIHLGFVVLYMLPQQWFGTHSDPFPANYPSYMVNDMCASGADGHTCPGPGVPMPRPAYNP